MNRNVELTTREVWQPNDGPKDSLRRASLQISCLVQALFLVPGAKFKGDARNGRREIVSPLAARSADDVPVNISTCSTLAQNFHRGCCDDQGVSVCGVEKYGILHDYFCSSAFFVRVGVSVRSTFHRHAHSAHVFLFDKVSVERGSVSAVPQNILEPTVCFLQHHQRKPVVFFFFCVCICNARSCEGINLRFSRGDTQ